MILQITPIRRRRAAFTLVEALLAATILSIVSAAAVLPFCAGTQQINEAARMQYAVALGEAMMEEVLARSFEDENTQVVAYVGMGPGIIQLPAEPAPTGRTAFDSMLQFNGFTESAGNLKSYDEQVISDDEFQGYWRKVSVEYVTFPGQAVNDANRIIRIKVEVYRDTTLMMTLTRLATKET